MPQIQKYILANIKVDLWLIQGRKKMVNMGHIWAKHHLMAISAPFYHGEKVSSTKFWLNTQINGKRKGHKTLTVQETEQTARHGANIKITGALNYCGQSVLTGTLEVSGTGLSSLVFLKKDTILLWQ